MDSRRNGTTPRRVEVTISLTDGIVRALDDRAAGLMITRSALARQILARALGMIKPNPEHQSERE